MIFCVNHDDGSTLQVTTGNGGNVLVKAWDREGETISVLSPVLALRVARQIAECADIAEREAAADARWKLEHQPDAPPPVCRICKQGKGLYDGLCHACFCK